MARLLVLRNFRKLMQYEAKIQEYYSLQSYEADRAGRCLVIIIAITNFQRTSSRKATQKVSQMEKPTPQSTDWFSSAYGQEAERQELLSVVIIISSQLTETSLLTGAQAKQNRQASKVRFGSRLRFQGKAAIQTVMMNGVYNGSGKRGNEQLRQVHGKGKYSVLSEDLHNLFLYLQTMNRFDAQN